MYVNILLEIVDSVLNTDTQYVLKFEIIRIIVFVRYTKLLDVKSIRLSTNNLMSIKSINYW